MVHFKDFKTGSMYLLGTVLSIPFLILLIFKAVIYGSIYNIVTFAIFGSISTLFLLFLTLYNWLNISKNAELIIRKFVLILLSCYIFSINMTFSQVLDFSAFAWIHFSVTLAITLFEIIFFAIWTKISKLLSTIILLSLNCSLMIFYVPILLIFTKNNSFLCPCILLLSVAISVYSSILNIFEYEDKFTSNFWLNLLNFTSIILNYLFIYLFII